MLLDAGASVEAANALGAIGESDAEGIGADTLLMLLGRLGAVVDVDPRLLLLRSMGNALLGRETTAITDVERAAALADADDAPESRAVARRAHAYLGLRLAFADMRDEASAAAERALAGIGPGAPRWRVPTWCGRRWRRPRTPRRAAACRRRIRLAAGAGRRPPAGQRPLLPLRPGDGGAVPAGPVRRGVGDHRRAARRRRRDRRRALVVPAQRGLRAGARQPPRSRCGALHAGLRSEPGAAQSPPGGRRGMGPRARRRRSG